MDAMQARRGAPGVAEKMQRDEEVYRHPDGERVVLVSETRVEV